MQKRTLGKSKMSVSPVGVGCMSLSSTYGPSEDSESIALIHRALDLGVNLFDSADVYGYGHNEELVGKAFHGHRDRAFIATKFGNTKEGPVRGSPEYVQQACEASLKRLNMNHIDLYYQHRVDASVPIEDTVGAMARLVEQGKVRYLGLSEAAPATIRRAHKVHPITAIQSEYSIAVRDVGDTTLPVCRELGVSFVAYASLGRGMLAGEIMDLAMLNPNDRRLTHPRFHNENFQANLKMVRKLMEIAKEKKVTTAQLVLAWVLAQGDEVVTIPGTRRIPRLEENLGALNVKLSQADLRWLDEAVPKGAMAGERYPDRQMKNVQL